MERPPIERAMSTDVVLDIVLCHLKARDLLTCRKVSKFWNKAASLVLRKRATMVKKISEESELMELKECIEQNSDFPFAGLQFNEPWRLNSPLAKEFFKNYGASFTSLSLRVSKETRIQDLTLFVNHLPRLSTLELCQCWGHPRHSELLDSTARKEDNRILNLPSLRTFKIYHALEKDLLLQVFRAASPSRRIKCPNATYGLLRELKSAGELQAVTVLNVFRDEGQKEYALKGDNLLSTKTPKLTELTFHAGGCISRRGLIKLLISSQNTLTYLRLAGVFPSQFLSECPVLPKLTTLSLCIVGESCEYVFQGRQGFKFPELKTMELSTLSSFYHDCEPSSAKLSDGLFIVPSLTAIDLYAPVDFKRIQDLARSFPNVIKIRLNYSYFNDCPSDVWSLGAFAFLEKLTLWHYTVKQLTKKCVNMDSFLTGMSIGICENLRRHTQQNLKDTPFNDILRESPSILQLQNLKELIVLVELDWGAFLDELEEPPEESPFISMVSVWYALQMMPNLEAKFVYDDVYVTRWCYNEERKEKPVASGNAEGRLQACPAVCEIGTFFPLIQPELSTTLSCSLKSARLYLYNVDQTNCYLFNVLTWLCCMIFTIPPACKSMSSVLMHSS